MSGDDWLDDEIPKPKVCFQNFTFHLVHEEVNLMSKLSQEKKPEEKLTYSMTQSMMNLMLCSRACQR